VFHSASGQFTALNERYPKVPVPLEMQSEGTAEVLEWTPLKEGLSGIGLLRYRAGEKKGGSYEDVAIIDLSRGQVVSIEPYISGEVKSKWAWTQTAVTVTDGDGLSSYYELRKPKPVESARRDDNPFSFFGGGGRSSGRGGGPGIFGWIFR
jgi:hypothetical protein